MLDLESIKNRLAIEAARTYRVAHWDGTKMTSDIYIEHSEIAALVSEVERLREKIREHKEKTLAAKMDYLAEVNASEELWKVLDET